MPDFRLTLALAFPFGMPAFTAFGSASASTASRFAAIRIWEYRSSILSWTCHALLIVVTGRVGSVGRRALS
jgi:hypothetical protein